jgi:hypothetical protein
MIGSRFGKGEESLAKFLNTTGVSYHLEQLLKNTKEKLILISPYLKVNDRIKLTLQDLDRFKIDIRLVYRDNQLNPVEQNWLRSLPTIRTSVCQSLHAKCYMNENEAIITSMNLYESSQVNNYEMGIHVAREQEPELYAAIYEEAMTLLRNSTEIQITVSEVPKTSRHPRLDTAGNGGFCIRCHAALKLNPLVPYCKDCYDPKIKRSDKSPIEKYCHICGKPHTSSLTKPTCYECFKANKDKLDFPPPPSK